MWRTGWLFIALFYFCTTFALPVYSPSQLSIIEKRGYLRVGIVAQNHPPFLFRTPDGQVQGIDIDLARQAAALLGVKVVFDQSAADYDQLMQNMFDKKYDMIISALVSIPSRATSIYFTTPYHSSPIGLLVNRVRYDALQKNKVPSFDKKSIKIGTQETSAYIRYIKFLYPNATLVLFKSTDELLDAVVSDKIDACMLDNLFIQAWQEEQPERAISTRYLPLPGYYADYAIATSYAYPILGAWLDNYVQEMINIGFLDQITAKYGQGTSNVQ